MEKICKDCGEFKEHLAKGLCKNCYDKKYYFKNLEKMKARHRKYYAENTDKVKTRHRKYYIKNSEKEKARRKRYYIKNSEKEKIAAEKWQAENPERNKANVNKYQTKNSEKMKINHKKWVKENPEKVREANFKRRINGMIEKGVIDKVINANILKYGIITCEKDKKPCPDDFHIDHIIPISKGGSNDYNNLQILCAKHNMEKHIDIADYRQNIENNQMFLKI